MKLFIILTFPMKFKSNPSLKPIEMQHFTQIFRKKRSISSIFLFRLKGGNPPKWKVAPDSTPQICCHEMFWSGNHKKASCNTQTPSLSLEQINATHSYLMYTDASFVVTLVVFDDQITSFPETYLSEVATTMSPTHWWRTVKGCGSNVNLSQITQNIWSCNASLSSIGQIFCIFDVVPNIATNHFEKSNLMFCHSMLRGSNELDYQYIEAWTFHCQYISKLCLKCHNMHKDFRS